MADGTRILEWHRVDRGDAVLRSFARAVAILAGGALVIGVSFLARAPLAVRIGATVVGFVAVTGGVVVALLGLQRPLQEDLYIALRPDGVLLHLAGQERVVPWGDIERVDPLGEEGGVVVRMRDGGALAIPHRFSDVTPAELASRMETARRKAGFDLLR